MLSSSWVVLETTSLAQASFRKTAAFKALSAVQVREAAAAAMARQQAALAEPEEADEPPTRRTGAPVSPQGRTY